MPRRYAWFILMALAAAACGGGSTGVDTLQASGGELAGIQFEVHENPG